MNRIMSGLNRLVRSFAFGGIALIAAMAVTGSVQAQTSAVPPGAGTAASPYLISQLGHLVWMGENVGSSSGMYYTVQNDIDASDTTNWNSGAGFAPIGMGVTAQEHAISPFLGIFDGNGKVISSLTVHRPGQKSVGFFGCVGTNAVVKNLGLTGCSVTGSNLVGSLVGQNWAGTVSGCYATGPVTGTGDYAGGLVGESWGGTVSNSYATGPVTGFYYVGGLIGWGSAKVNACHATGSVTGYWSYVGGLMGRNSGPVSDCYATGTVTGQGGLYQDEIGGLVGWNFGGTVSNSYATGAVSGDDLVGGLVGWNDGTVVGSYATGQVAGSLNMIGGLVGQNNYIVSRCFATGAVSGNNEVGGLVGENYYDIGTTSMSNSYATGTVTGNHSVGGLVGWNSAPVRGCYAVGAVAGNASIGGLVGTSTNAGSASSSYWDIQTSGRTNSAGGMGTNTTAMKQQATFVGWDFANVWSITESVTYPVFIPETKIIGVSGNLAFGNVAIGQIATAALTMTNGGNATLTVTSITYPTGFSGAWSGTIAAGNATNVTVTFSPVMVTAYSGTVTVNSDKTSGGNTLGASGTGTVSAVPPGAGTAASPYLISQLGHLAWMGDNAGNSSGRYYTVQNDMDASDTTNWNSGAGLAPIGTGDYDGHPVMPFMGTFDGNGKVISNLVINRPSENGVSLFGCLGTSGVVENLGLVGGSVTGDRFAGGLVGVNHGTVRGCYATSPVTAGDNYVGGLVGLSDGTVSDCHATGQVAGGYNFVGGLMGLNQGVVRGCYATGPASGPGAGDRGSVGGLVGNNNGGLVSNCYATGSATASKEVGGLVGASDGTVSGCYATGPATGSTSIGGLVGYNYGAGTVNNSYWDMQTSGQTNSAGGMGTNTAAMKQQATFVGWDFANVWSITENVTYPLFIPATKIIGVSGNLAFGNVATGQTATATMTITNSGNATLTVTNITYPTGFAGAWSGTIAAGNATNVTVTFAPVALTTYSGTVTVNSDASSGGDTISASGTGITVVVMKIIGVSGNLAFGIVTMGQTATATMTITNSGNAALTVTNITYPTGFTGAWSGTIAAGKATNVTVTFSPVAVTTYSGTVTVNSDKTSGGNTISASGTGTAAVVPPGAGTAASPYLISQLGHLVWVGENVGSSSGKYYSVLNNIDASATTNWNSGAGFAPIGGMGVGTFGGIFNGNGKVISKLTINRPGQDGVGLFGIVSGASDAPDSYVVKNLGLTGCSVKGNNFVGALVGYNDKGSTVSGCFASGTIVGSVTGTNGDVGGLVGMNDDTAMISNCYASCSVTGDNYVGGLVGHSGYYKVTDCYATGPVHGQLNVGGLVGLNEGMVSACYATGPVAGSNYVGGLVGCNSGGSTTNGDLPGMVSDCYAAGAVTGNAWVGGLVGTSTNASTTTNSYWDMQTSGQATSAGGMGKTTAQMKQKATFAGWDFANVWRITENATYPLFVFQPATKVVQNDFDNDGKSDIGVFCPLSGAWDILKSSGGYMGYQLGYGPDLAVAADYDGDGKADYALFEPPTGNWFIKQSSNGNFVMKNWGWSRELPVPADYDGDGKADIAVYDPPTGTWYIRKSSDGGMIQRQWGWSQALPVPADYDGDGKADIATYVPGAGLWTILQSSNGQLLQINWGWSQAMPVPADYDGDGKADIATYVPGAGQWLIRRSSDGGLTQQNWGWYLAAPVPGDYDGDGRADIATYCAQAGLWYILKSSGGMISQNWGWSQAVPTTPQFQINRKYFPSP